MARPTIRPYPCSIEGCDKPVVSRGWCNVHYRRWQRTGDPETVLVIHGDTEARFWAKVSKQGPNDCWPWLGGQNPDGYGVLGTGGTTNQLAHRWSYEHHKGPIPEGLILDHLCRVRNCVNPDHLEPVTIGENNRRSPLRGEDKTSCVNGHPYDEGNTIWTLVRICRTCKTETQHKSAARRRQKFPPRRIGVTPRKRRT